MIAHELKAHELVDTAKIRNGNGPKQVVSKCPAATGGKKTVKVAGACKTSCTQHGMSASSREAHAKGVGGLIISCGLAT